jgi:hypothetical protein
MADQAIGLAHPAFVPGGSIVGIARTEGSIVTIKNGVISRDLVTRFLSLLIVVEILFAVIFSKSSPRMAGPTILEEGERRLIDIRGTLVCFFGQLARID